MHQITNSLALSGGDHITRASLSLMCTLYLYVCPRNPIFGKIYSDLDLYLKLVSYSVDDLASGNWGGSAAEVPQVY